MPSLAEYIENANTGADAIQKAPIVEENTGVRCLRIGDISQKKPFLEWGFTNAKPDIVARFQLKKGDIIIARTGNTIGVNKFIKEDLQSVYNNGLIRLRVNAHSAVPEFIYYNLQTDRFREFIRSIAFGTSTQPNMQIKDMLRYEVANIAKKEQKAIVCILRALDDKIELNRKMNETLEAMAQALFKSWFVDFDPVCAKSEGRLPEGMNEETAALFPEAFEESDFGLAPKDWQIMSLGDLLIPKRGKSITKSKCVEGNIPVVAGGLGPAYFHNQYNVSSPVVTISASGANAGFVRLYQNDIWASDCSFISSEQTNIIFFWYIFLKFNQEKIYSMQQGAAQPHIYPSDLMRLPICLPRLSQLQRDFNSLVSPIFSRIGLANSKIQTLANLRDTLLPRLISGQLRIPDAEAELEKITS